MADEKRLIDAYRLWEYAWNELQKANKRHENEPGFKVWSSGVAEVIAALAKDMPTVDAVEVVRCKDCRSALSGDGRIIKAALVCTKSVNWRAVEPDHFCSYGERRADNG